MSRVGALGRTGMYTQALEHILEKDKEFPYTIEELEEAMKASAATRYNEYPDKRFNLMCKEIDSWLNARYDMFELDYTNFDDNGSRDEVTLCYTKVLDRPFGAPDFANELPQVVFYR